MTAVGGREGGVSKKACTAAVGTEPVLYLNKEQDELEKLLDVLLIIPPLKAPETPVDTHSARIVLLYYMTQFTYTVGEKKNAAQKSLSMNIYIHIHI